MESIPIAKGYLPEEIKKVGYYYQYKFKKYRTKEEAIYHWYRDQVAAGHIK